MSTHSKPMNPVWLKRAITAAILVTVLAVTWMSWTLYYAYQIASVEIPRALKMQDLHGRLVWFDELSVMSVRLTASTGDTRWEKRYRFYEAEQDDALKLVSAMTLGAKADRAIAVALSANEKTDAVELRALELSHQKRDIEALALLERDEYKKPEKLYGDSMEEIATLLKQSAIDTQQHMQRETRKSIMVAATVVLVLLLCWGYILAMMRRWQASLVQTNRQLNEQSQQLEEFSHQLDNKVAERTKQLRSSEIALQNMISDMVRSQAKVQRALDDLKLQVEERKKAEVAMRESENRFRSYFEMGLIGMAITSPSKECLEVNDEFCRILGYERRELLYMSWADITHPDDLAADIAQFNRVLEGEMDSYILDKRWIRKDGRVIDTTISPKCVRRADGSVEYLVALMQDITERKRAEADLEKAHRELLETSRRAGMAEVATGVLHNVGNVLNSVNVASSCVADSLRKSKSVNLTKVAELMRNHSKDLGEFMTADPQGMHLVDYISQLALHLNDEQTAAIKELAGLQKNIEHIKEIVTMQQSFAKGPGLTETLSIQDLLEDALKMNASALVRHSIQVAREFEAVSPIKVEKHKLLQILVNLVRNGIDACVSYKSDGRRLNLRVSNGQDRVRIAVSDNGVGIPSENLTRIFAHGFTTKKDGHGFGLHSGVLAAEEMGGSLTVMSDGSGKGATFTVELPIDLSKTRLSQIHASPRVPK